MNVNVNEMTIKEIADLKGVTFQTINRYIKERKIKETKVLKRQLEEKDAQIAMLQKIIDQQQKLNLIDKKELSKKKIKILFWKK